MPIIDLDEVSFRYKGADEPALKNISISIEPGEFVGIIGPTGAGKSTLCWVIIGIAPQILRGKLEGEITVKGLHPNKVAIPEITQVVGLVQQDAEAQLLMTDVEKEILFPMENLGLRREEMTERLNRVLDITNLRENRLRHPFYLSGGQKQRVAVAAALAMEPEILILDEATSELDPIGAEEVHRLAGDLKEKGKTIVMVEHNIDELAKYTDRIIVMNEGEKVRDDDTKAILSDIDFLCDLGVYPPQVTQVAHELRGKGYPIGDELPHTMPEMLDLLSKIGAKS